MRSWSLTSLWGWPAQDTNPMSVPFHEILFISKYSCCPWAVQFMASCSAEQHNRCSYSEKWLILGVRGACLWLYLWLVPQTMRVTATFGTQTVVRAVKGMPRSFTVLNLWIPLLVLYSKEQLYGFPWKKWNLLLLEVAISTRVTGPPWSAEGQEW